MAHIGIDARLTYYRTGGISTYTRRLVAALEKLDLKNRYTVFHSRKDEQRITTRFESNVLWTPAHHKIERLALSVELARHGLDVFHSPDFIPPYRGAKKHVITVHDLTFLHYPQYLTEDSRRYYNAQIQAAVNHADHILSVSEATKRDLMTMLNVPEEKITVQPHGAGEQYRPMSKDETEPVRKALDLPRDYILHVGTWEPRKNINGLVHAYWRLLHKMPDAPPLVLVGKPGWLFDEETRKMLHHRPFSLPHRDVDKVLFWRDNVTDEMLPAVYNMAATIVSPSFYEGFGMPALEAMACGVVPIVSNVSSLPEVVGDVGVLVDPNNLVTIADAMYDVLDNATWRKEMQAKAIKRAALFTWDNSARIAMDVYQKVMG
jgi:glycosyltransferase involved in cell wall biosynthesis